MKPQLFCRLSCIALSISGCATPFPVRPGEALTYSRSEKPLKPSDRGYVDTLQIRWLGTACNLIQVGDAAILTDPFFTHYRASHVFFGGDTPSDPVAVEEHSRCLPRPQAIFIGHAHYDHLLDLAELRRQKQWLDVPIIGGPTVGHIVAGYNEGIQQHHQSPCAPGQWCRMTDNVEYQAFPAHHSPHFLGKTLFEGTLADPRTDPPKTARDFPIGEPYTYLFRFSYGEEGKSFTVFFASAATDADHGIPDLAEGVDAAILCTPGWKNVRDYPAGAIRRLRPRVVILSHLDNFLQKGWEKRELVATAHLDGFLREAREASIHEAFERIVITDTGTTVHIPPR